MNAIVNLGSPRTSYRATTWVGQFRQLFSTRAGYEAMRTAGVQANARTLNAWLDVQRSPSAANKAAIARAYNLMQRGFFPRLQLQPAEMKITGLVKTGDDERFRGAGNQNPLLIDLRFADWRRIEHWWNTGGDYDELDEYIAEDVIAADIGDGTEGGWEFPGSFYSVSIS